MSLVHIKLIHNDPTNLDVWCLDFNQEVEWEKIGKLKLFKDKFLYDSLLQDEEFCPPELFIKHKGDYFAVEEECKELNFNCMAWSYYIYKRAIEEINRNS